MTKRKRLLRALGVVCAGLALLVALAYRPVLDHGRAALLLLGMQRQPVPGLLRWVPSHEVTTRDVTLPSGVRARLYSPVGLDDPPCLVFVHGVHRLGIDEPRQVALVRSVAATGLAVLTPEIASLTEYRFDPRSLATIEEAAREAARLTQRDRAGLMAISFGGGLALLAAAEHPESIGFVVTVGAHHDLARVARFLAGEADVGPHGERADVVANVYGAGVFVYAHLERFFDAGDVPVAREILRTALSDDYRGARARLGELSPDGRTRMTQLFLDPSNSALRQRFLDEVARAAPELAAVSPKGRLAQLEMPIFLLHGADDPIIPSTETLWLASELPEAHVVVTKLLRHAEMDGAPPLEELWELVHFMGLVLTEARGL